LTFSERQETSRAVAMKPDGFVIAWANTIPEAIDAAKAYAIDQNWPGIYLIQQVTAIKLHVEP